MMARYINADYALIALKVFNDKKNGNPHFLNGIETAKEIIEELPTADVRENVKGEWFAFDIDSERYDEIKCSVCRKAFIVDAQRYCDIGFIKDDLNFCPNCGADMRGKNEQQE